VPDAGKFAMHVWRRHCLSVCSSHGWAKKKRLN